MKTFPKYQKAARARGLSLVEITLVIALMLMLASVITYSLTSMGDWKKGRSAGEKLKAVYLAQKSYLADHPTESYGTLSSTKIIPYLPGRSGALPTQNSLDNENLSLVITVMPPVFQLGGADYDPSGSGSDGMWDVGGL